MTYDNPGGLIAAAVILQTIVFVCIGLRLASRRKLKQSLLVSDYIILIAALCGIGLTVIMIYGCAVKAFGVPLDATIQDPTAVTGRVNIAKHLELSFLLLGILTLGLIKISISFFYLHIFNTPVFRKVIIVWIVILVLWTASFIIAGLAECGSHLLALFGTPQTYLEHCGSAIPTGWAMVGSNLATDVITLVLPIPMIWSLQMSLHRKVLVMATFGIGLLSIGASIAKSYIYIAASLSTYHADGLLLLTAIGVWNLVEVQVGIMAACAPPMRPILSDLLPRDSFVNLLDSIKGRFSGSSRSDLSYSKKSFDSSESDGHNSFAEMRDHSYSARVDSEERVGSTPDGIMVRNDVRLQTVNRV